MKKVTRCLVLFTLLLLLTSQIAHAEPTREIARLGRGTATSLAWRPDGKLLAMGSATGVWLLDENLNIIGNPYSFEVNELSWSSKGDKIAIIGKASTSCNTQIWDSKFKQVIADLKICGDRLVWSPDDTYLVVLQKNLSSIHIFDANEAKKILVLAGNDFIWSPNGRELITVRYSTSSDDASEIAIEEITSGRTTNYKREIYPTMPLLAATTNHTVITLCPEISDDRIQISLCHLNIETDERTNIEELFSSSIGDPGYWIDSLKLQRQDGEKFAYTIQTTTRGFLNNFILVNLKANSGGNIGNSEIFAWKPSSNIITNFVGNGLIQNIDTTTQSVINEEMLFTAPINSIAWKPDGKQIVSTGFGYEQYARVWNVNKTDQQPDLILYNEPAELVSYTSHTNELITAGTIYTDIIVNHGISSWDADTGAYARSIDGFYSQFESLPLTAWNSDFTHSAKNDLVSNIVEIDNGINVVAAAKSVKDIFWSPDDSMIATISTNNDEMSTSIEIWNVKSGKHISELKTYGSAINNFSWNPNSQEFAVRLTIPSAYGMANFIEIYQIADTNQQSSINLSDKSSDQISLIWSHDGQKLLVTTPQAIDIYRASDLTQTGSIEIPPTTAMSLSPDDKRLALGMDDGTIRIWDVANLMATG